MRSYAIVQFEGNEIGILNKTLSNYDVTKLKSIIEEVLHVKVKSISLAKGRILYEDDLMPLTYLRIELDNNDQYTFEIYEESAYIVTNTNVKTSYEVLTKLIMRIAPGVKIRRRSSLISILGESTSFIE